MKATIKAFVVLAAFLFAALEALQWVSAVQLRQGENYYENEEWLNALDAFESSSFYCPFDPEPHHLIGKTYLHLLAGRNSNVQIDILRKAESASIRAVSIEDGYPYYWSVLGRVSELIERLGGDPEYDALYCYQRARNIDPNNPLFMEFLAKYLIKKGGRKEAGEILAEAFGVHVEIARDVARVWLDKGYGAEELIDILGDDAGALIELAGFLRTMPEYSDEALHAGERAYEIDPADPVVIRVYGLILSDSGDCDRLRPIVGRPGLEEPGRSAYAACLVKKRELDLAAEEYLKLISLNPEKPDYRWELARIYLKRKNRPLAKEQLVWIATRPETEGREIRIRAYLELARIFEHENDIDKALRYYYLCLAERPGAWQIKEKIDRLEKIKQGGKISSPWEIKNE